MHHSVDEMIAYHRRTGALSRAVAFVNNSGQWGPITSDGDAERTIRQLAKIAERDEARSVSSGGWIVSKVEGMWELHFDALMFWSVDHGGTDGD